MAGTFFGDRHIFTAVFDLPKYVSCFSYPQGWTQDPATLGPAQAHLLLTLKAQYIFQAATVSLSRTGRSNLCAMTKAWWHIVAAAALPIPRTAPKDQITRHGYAFTMFSTPNLFMYGTPSCGSGSSCNKYSSTVHRRHFLSLLMTLLEISTSMTNRFRYWRNQIHYNFSFMTKTD